MEFVCPDENATVRAANVRATLAAFKLHPTLGQQIVEKHSLRLDDLRPENMVKVQLWLNALKDIQATLGSFTVRDVGSHIVQNADFPPSFGSVESVLLALDQIYYMNHKGNVGHYHVAKEGDTVTIRCETPYPRQFERGLVEGICKNDRLARGRKYFVRFDEGAADANVTCTLTVIPLG